MRPALLLSSLNTLRPTMLEIARRLRNSSVILFLLSSAFLVGTWSRALVLSLVAVQTRIWKTLLLPPGTLHRLEVVAGLTERRRTFYVASLNVDATGNRLVKIRRAVQLLEAKSL